MFTEQQSVDIALRILILGPLALGWIVGVVNLVGLRSFSKMTAFDFITTLATGSLLAAAAGAGKWPTFLVSCGAVLILLGFQALVAAGRARSAKWLSMLENEPMLLMKDGAMIPANLRKCRVTENDLIAKLREANVLELKDVRAVVLETTGDISVLHGDKLNEELLAGVRES